MPAAEVLKILPLEIRRSLLGPRKMTFPAAGPEITLFAAMREPAGMRFLLIDSSVRENGPSPQTLFCAALTTANIPASLQVPQVVRPSAQNPHPFDLYLTATLRILDGATLLEQGICDLASETSPLLAIGLCEFLVTRLRERIAEAAAACDPRELKQGRAASKDWWSLRINEWLEPMGLSATLTGEPRWSSVSLQLAEQAQLAEQRQREAKEQSERENKLRLEQMELAASFDQRQKQIQFDTTLSEQKRTGQLEISAREFQLNSAKMTAALEEMRQQSEASAAKHALEMQRLSQERFRLESTAALRTEVDRVALEAELQQARLRVEQAEQSRKRAQSRLQEIRDDQRVLETDAAAALVARLLVARDPVARVRLATELLQEHDYSCAMLRRLGIDVERELLLDMLRRKAAEKSISLRFVDPSIKPLAATQHFASRSIGLSPASSLKSRGLVSFRARVGRSGYVTLLNFGSTGSCQLHCPSFWVDPANAYVRENTTVNVPGDPILPQYFLDQLGLEYQHDGNLGWEHMALIVSKVPLFDREALSRACDDAPLMSLDESEVDALRNRLEGADPADWACGVHTMHVSEGP